MARSGRGWRGMLALGLAAACVAVPAGAAPTACPVPDAQVKGTDGWTRIAAPKFSAGGDTMTSYAVDEMRPERLYATNGVAIASSRDGGCTWAEATLPDDELSAVAPLGGESGRIAQARLLDIQLPFAAASTVWAVGLTDVVAGGTPLVEPRVLVSVDGGGTFAMRTTRLPQFARPIALRTAASPLEAYLLLEETLPVENRALWRTLNGGAAWEKVSDAPFDDFAVDVFRRALWAWDEQALYVSRDMGGTWSRLGVPGAPLRVDVAPLFTSVVLSGGRRLDFLALDQAIPGPAPDMVTSVTAGPGLGLVAMSSVVSGVTVDPPFGVRQAPMDVTPEDVTLSDLNFAQLKDGDAFVLYGFSPRALYRRSVKDDFAVPPPPKVDVTVTEPRLLPPGKPMLRPPGSLVTLKPGEVRRVGYELVLPPTPTPLDVYFMTDSTGSMQNAIAAVQEGVQDIVDDLTAAGIDLHFGVADFRDYPQAPGDTITYPYKRRRPVGPVKDELADALESITTGGGNGPDSALEAIYQAVTAEGRTGLTASIPKGQGAEFRKDALKVVLLASDEEMRDPSPTEPWNAGPTKQAVIDALVKHEVEIVGIRVSSGGPRSPRPEMEELAEAAGSVAPDGGVDCDGDDEPDIDEGQALVCDFASGQDSIAPAFIGMLRGLKDLADVHVGVTGPRDVVRHLGDDVFEARNVKAMNTLPVPVEYRCTPARYGTDTPVTIEGVLRGRILVSETATVRCLAPPKVAPVIPPVVVRKPPPRPLRAAAVPPPPPPQPNPNVNPNPNPNPQTQANAGMASQEEQQHQLAVADMEITEDEELAFSALDNRKAVTPAVTLVAGAILACAAAGAQLHLARRTRVATNPSRGDRR